MRAKLQPQIAVFARNHLPYLDYATSVASDDSERKVTFRSRKAWSGAKRALEALGRLPVFFAVVGQADVRYKATLQEIQLNPRTDDVDTQRLLRLVPPQTEGEGLWDEAVHTLYVVSGCYRIDQPRPLSSLNLADDGSPLSENFKYSYALVRDEAIDIRDRPAPDTAPPPARVDATISRIIRDTALVCRLKAFYNDTCQLCGTRLTLRNGRGYSEGHHLRPLGAPHDGPDVADNIVIVCPNCHALLDRCSLTLETIPKCHPDHPISQLYISYHNALPEPGAQAIR